MNDNYDRVMAVQYGGNHYKNHEIQPWQIWEAYDMNGWEASAVKYLLRHKYKGNSLEDLMKAKHNIEYLIAREERKLNVQIENKVRESTTQPTNPIPFLREGTDSTTQVCT
jgi:hypothetical protein